MDNTNPLQKGSSTSQLQHGENKIFIVIPAHNEERFIGSTVLRARQICQHVLVMDDGSTDQTAAIARLAGAEVISRDKNLGKGVALNSALNHVRQYKPDVVISLDADGQHSPEEIDHVAAPILSGQADIVIGSRYLGDSSDTPRHRILGHRIFNWLTSAASGVHASDSQSGFRAFSPAALELPKFHSKGFSVESEMQFLINQHGLRLVEAPITIKYPDKPKRNVFSHGMLVLNGLLRLIGQYRLLLFFGLPGVVLLVVGLLWGVFVVEIYQRSLKLATGYAMISILLTILGSLFISTGIILHSIRGLLTDMEDNIYHR
jgi:glycosyltransferase involved in cell wall biosynthesis